jgi:ubiquitin-conjugating enzyme E2 G2
MTTTVASKRLFQEYKHLTQDPPDGITAGPIEEDDLFTWEALIQGPEDTPYEGGIFPAELKFPKDYPLMPPTMKFLCDLWHPNGEIENSFFAFLFLLLFHFCKRRKKRG